MVKCGGAPPVMALFAYSHKVELIELIQLFWIRKLSESQFKVRVWLTYWWRQQWHYMWVTSYRHQWHLHTLYWAGITWAAVTAFVVSAALQTSVLYIVCVCRLSLPVLCLFVSALSPSSFLCICFLLVWWENTALRFTSMLLSDLCPSTEQRLHTAITSVSQWH